MPTTAATINTNRKLFMGDLIRSHKWRQAGGTLAPGAELDFSTFVTKQTRLVTQKTYSLSGSSAPDTRVAY